MARPKSSIKNLKVLQINIRVTLKEQLLIEKQAKTHGISVVEYIRRRTLNKQLPKLKVAPINRKLLIELSRCGNNINQLTKKVHQKQTDSIGLKKELQNLEVLLNSIKEKLLS